MSSREDLHLCHERAWCSGWVGTRTDGGDKYSEGSKGQPGDPGEKKCWQGPWLGQQSEVPGADMAGMGTSRAQKSQDEQHGLLWAPWPGVQERGLSLSPPWQPGGGLLALVFSDVSALQNSVHSKARKSPTPVMCPAQERVVVTGGSLGHRKVSWSHEWQHIPKPAVEGWGCPRGTSQPPWLPSCLDDSLPPVSCAPRFQHSIWKEMHVNTEASVAQPQCSLNLPNAPPKYPECLFISQTQQKPQHAGRSTSATRGLPHGTGLTVRATAHRPGTPWGSTGAGGNRDRPPSLTCLSSVSPGGAPADETFCEMVKSNRLCERKLFIQFCCRTCLLAG